MTTLDVWDAGSPHHRVLAKALHLAGFAVVRDAALAALDGHLPEGIEDAVRVMTFYMATLNGGNPDAGSILHTIATATWEAIGLPMDARPPLILEQRLGIITALMGVCRAIIEAERARLANVIALDTTLPSTTVE